tara:strand:+ start:512 stop:784 length:273 start_codon:yes stop_codon:yes gene_type:complete
MEISDLIDPTTLYKFDKFCREVQKATMENLSFLHNETFNSLDKNKDLEFVPKNLKRDIYKACMEENKFIVNKKRSEALNKGFKLIILEND